MRDLSRVYLSTSKSTTSKKEKEARFQKMLFYVFIISIIASFLDGMATMIHLTPSTIYLEGNDIARFFLKHFGLFFGSIIMDLYNFVTRGIVYLIFRKVKIANKLLFWLFIIIIIGHLLEVKDWMNW